jgi:DNA-binding protein HU-beta
MNKADLVQKIHDHLGGTKVQAERVMDIVIDTITTTLTRGDDVSIAGLGIFTTSTRKARSARNPRTGETIQVPAMKVPKFRPAKSLKDSVKKS